MDKPLSDPQNKADIQSQETNKPANSFSRSLDAASSIGAYGSRQANDLKDLTSKAWKESANRTWASTPHGRLAIRTVSRGVMGAAFFAAGSFLANKWMTGYNSNVPFMEQNNPLQMIAKGFDNVVGAPIEWAASQVVGEEAAQRFVSFRPTKYGVTAAYGDKPARLVAGRSLGSEVVNITFDFFSGSVGDAMGRDIVSLLDPNEKKPWQDENGRGNLLTLADNTVNAAFRYVTYNGGEDWAVAVPYAFFMKGQRALIDKFSPGFKYDFDRNANGGSFKIDKDRNVIGSFAAEGMLDLQSRFTFYNTGTLMYRELYNHVKHLSQGKKSSLYGAPDAPGCEDKTLLQSAGDTVKWGLRSAIKATLYMTPSIPFFSVTRTSQHKSRGVFVDQERNQILEFIDDKGKASVLRGKDRDALESKVFYAGYNNGWEPLGADNVTERFKPLDKKFDFYDQDGKWYDVAVNKIGKIQHDRRKQVADNLTQPIDTLIEAAFPKGSGGIGRDKQFSPKTFLGVTETSEYLKRMTNAAISYTPYMMAKAELANLWDDGKMDLAAERLIDGATSFNWGEFKAGAKEVYNAVLRKPLPEPEREVEAQHRIELDTSAPVSFSQTQAERRRVIEDAKKRRDAMEQKTEERLVSKATGLSWQERMVAAKDNALTDSPTPDSRPRSFAENEAMKKALQELKSPSSAIH